MERSFNFPGKKQRKTRSYRISSSKRSKNVHKPGSLGKNLQGKAACFEKIITKPNIDGDIQRRYKLLNVTGVNTCGSVRQKIFDLTPHVLDFDTCYRTTDCADLLKTQIPPLEETIDFFRNPSLHCADVFSSFQRCVNMIDKAFGHAVQMPVRVKKKETCFKKIAKSALVNMMDIKETYLNRRSTAGRAVIRQNENYQKFISTQPLCMDQMVQAMGAHLRETTTQPDTNMDPETIGTAKRNTGVNVYEQNAFVQKPNPGIIDRTVSKFYVKKCPLYAALDQIVKPALIIEKYLDLSKQKLKDIGRRYSDKDMDFIFTLQSNLGKVTLIDWYSGPEFIIAASHETTRRDKQGRRLSVICIWKLINTKNPERFYTFSTDIINMEFSKRKPHQLLLVVCRNGDMHVLNTASRTRLLINPNDNDVARHIVASNHPTDSGVRYASWFNQDERRNGNTILCCRDDGELRKYIVKRPFLKYTSLMIKWTRIKEPKLPRLIVEDERYNTSGIFYVVTGDGGLHKISQLSREVQHVYKVRDTITSFDYSPYMSQLLVTSSFSGNIHVWWENSTSPLSCFARDGVPVTKACWHPTLSTSIISIVGTEILTWDIRTRDKSKPHVIETLPSNLAITDFKLSRNGLICAIADNRGKVFLFQMMTSKVSRENQILLLCKAVLSWQPDPLISDYLSTLLTDKHKLNEYSNTFFKNKDAQESDQLSHSCESKTSRFQKMLAMRLNDDEYFDENEDEHLEADFSIGKEIGRELTQQERRCIRYIIKKGVVTKMTCVKQPGRRMKCRKVCLGK